MNQNLESMCKLAITEFQDIPFEKLEAMLMPESVACKMPIGVTDMYDGTYKLSLASDVFLHNNEKLVNCKEDVIETLDLANMTVAQIAEVTEKTERGIRTLLTRRGIDCQDYKGSEKKAKNEEKKAA